MNTYLTKSRFTLGLTCPQKLVYQARNRAGEGHYVDQRDGNTMLQGLAEGGHQIGALAQSLFKQADGDAAREISARNQQTQIAQTTEALVADDVTLFEPTIAYGQFLVRVDVLRKKGSHIELIEVKSKSFDSRSDRPDKNPFRLTARGEVNGKFLSYVRDLAFQYWVVSQAYPAWDIHCYLMMPDKAVKAREEGLHQRLPVQFDEVIDADGQVRAHVDAVDDLQNEYLGESFLRCIPLDTQVQRVLNSEVEIPGTVDDFAGVAQQLADRWTDPASLTPAPVGAHCKDCEFYTPVPSAQAKSGFHECWAQRLGVAQGYQREDTVFGLYSPVGRGPKSTRGLLDAGISWLNEIDSDTLGLPPSPNGQLTTADRQRMQLTGEWPGGGDHYFDQQGFAHALAGATEKFGWPLYFLDFEAARSALPFRAGMRPNSIQIFQYSLHAMEADGSVRHAGEFLDLSPQGDVNTRMLRSLKRALGARGTVLHWTPYEISALRAAREQLLEDHRPPDDRDELVAFIETLTEARHREGGDGLGMVDQAKWAEWFYFHPQTHGKFSIKPLLPAVMGASDHLRELYARPVYGSDALPSPNFSCKAWWVEEHGCANQPCDPYKLLENVFPDGLLENSADAKYYQRFAAINEGGGAMMAYIRSQSGVIEPAVRRGIEQSLRQYCELDTLAMVMIMQAWRAEAGV